MTVNKLDKVSRVYVKQSSSKWKWGSGGEVAWVCIKLLNTIVTKVGVFTSVVNAVRHPCPDWAACRLEGNSFCLVGCQRVWKVGGSSGTFYNFHKVSAVGLLQLYSQSRPAFLCTVWTDKNITVQGWAVRFCLPSLTAPLNSTSTFWILILIWMETSRLLFLVSCFYSVTLCFINDNYRIVRTCCGCGGSFPGFSE